jgi:predicted nuclease of predicted toxin-antitoxin system
VSLKILTDEDISPQVSLRLQQDGFDVCSVRDRGLLHLKDWQLMTWCMENQRAICTKNRDDFVREHTRRLVRGQQHYGVLVVGDWKPDAVYWTLRQYLEQTDPNLPPLNQVVILLEVSPPLG